MSESFINRLSSLFREIEVDLGTTELCILCLEALYDAIEDLKHQELHQFCTKLKDLALNIESTQPKYAIIIDSFFELLRTVYKEDHQHINQHCPIPKSKFLEILRKIINDKKTIQKEIVKQTEKINLNKKTILIYNHSDTLEKILQYAKRKKQIFNIIVAEQDFDKTGEIIDFLHKNRIQYRVVPSYMVSHVEKDIDIVFLSALTLKSNMEFVTDTGTNGVVAQFHLKKKPIYLFISTAKFSLWKAKEKSEIFTHIHKRTHYTKSIDFERIKFSHDRVDLNLVSKIVTEEGIFTPEQIAKIYKEKLEARLAFEKSLSASSKC